MYGNCDYVVALIILPTSFLTTKRICIQNYTIRAGYKLYAPEAAIKNTFNSTVQDSKYEMLISLVQFVLHHRHQLQLKCNNSNSNAEEMHSLTHEKWGGGGDTINNIMKNTSLTRSDMKRKPSLKTRVRHGKKRWSS
jgi:hypothetical protein